jgi:ketosteroid isomerase-like protein
MDKDGSIEQVIAAHLDAWNAPDGPARAQAIAALYATDVFVGEPGAAHRGHTGMAQAIADLQAQLPGTTITRSGPVQTAQDLVTYTWELGTAGQAATATGRDVLIIRDGLITSLYVVIDGS